MLSRLRAHLPAWRRALRRRRRLLAALSLAALIAAALPSLLPPSARGIEVIVAEAPIAAGAVLRSEDLRTARIAPELAWEGMAREAEQVVGRTARLPLEPGAPVLPGMLEDPGGTAIPEGAAVMAVPVPEVLVDHLGPGTEIALLGTDPASASHAAIPATVIEVITPVGGAGALGGGATGTAEALVAVEERQAGEVAHALGIGAVTVAVIGS